MPKGVGPERRHFGGGHDLITETQGSKTKYYWKCMYCDYILGGKSFQNKKSHIHLSGDTSFRTGLIVKVCTAAPDEVKAEFKLLEMTKRLEKEQIVKKRKRAEELLKCKKISTTPPSKQSKLYLRNTTTLSNDQVDEAWDTAFFGLDIPVTKIVNPLFREDIEATK